jgi:hypothetical protein
MPPMALSPRGSLWSPKVKPSAPAVPDSEIVKLAEKLTRVSSFTGAHIALAA